MVRARKYVVRRRFSGEPRREDFEVVEHELPPVANGQLLVKVEWLSVDPYQRAYHGGRGLPYDQFGYQVALVLDSKNPRFPVGSRVVSHQGWCDYCVLNAADATDFADRVYRLPELRGLSPSLGVGAVGMPGATAYFGLLEICKPRAGETVVVSGAAGAVGSLVGQIAKIKGCRVIGFAGSDDKVRWLEGELGFDRAFNYKTADVAAALAEAAPAGVDCYFDNVGGEMSSAVMSRMNEFGRVAVCGAIDSYNAVAPGLATVTQPFLTQKQLRVEGFLVWRWAERWGEAFAVLSGWLASGRLVAREHVSHGFDNVFDAFLGMMRGDNLGKAVVQI